MSPRKLSDGDRQDILSLYRNTNETTSTLAMRFGVSSSTVSRFLKNSLTETEYEDLIQEKRLARTAKNEDDEEDYSSAISSENINIIVEKEPLPVKEIQEEQLNLNFEHITKDSMENEIEDLVAHQPEMETDNFLDENNQGIVEPMDQDFKDILPAHTDLAMEVEETAVDMVEEEKEVLELSDMEEEEVLDLLDMEEEEVLDSVNVLAAMYGEDMEEEDDIDDEEEDDIDDEEETYEDEDIERKLMASSTSPENKLQVLPFDRAIFPRVCYIVIDRYAELVTKPLKDFGHLGNIPSSEFLQLTLPIFDNHKVAKRYCDTKGTLRARKGKVIKVPDGRLLQKTSHHLKAKGISRILMDGKIYEI